MIGLELMDDRASAVAVDDSGRIVARAQVVSTDLAAAAAAALEGVGAAGRGAAASLGVAAASPESTEVQGVLRTLARSYGGRFVQDGAIASGTAAALAETWIGAARDARDAIFFAVGDHVLAGILRDGSPFVGAHRRGLAVGWLALNPVEREDYRKAGCLETEVAAPGIVRRIVWRIKAGDHSRVQERVDGDLAAITVEHILEAARQGDGLAVSVVRDTAKYVGMAAANLVIVADPSVLILGGIMASSADLLLEFVRTELARRLPPAMMQALTIVPAALGSAAAAIGAAKAAAAAAP
jgi:predicted NBD/HSP70 family sugar kinase